MPAKQTRRPRLERTPTGVEGLDTILRGGLVRGGIFMVHGAPGAGKTILGNQICFRHAADGGCALYVTVLAENHARMLLHIGQLEFFEEKVIPDRLYYISAFRALEQEGLPGILGLLRREIQAHKASLLVLDGLSAIVESALGSLELKKLIHELQAQAAISDCTIVLLTGLSPTSAELTLVDGVIELQTKLYGRHAERALQVHKLRGSGYLRGEHAYRITEQGLIVYPRIEAVLAQPVAERVAGPPIGTGIAQLDAIMGGGFPQHSTALLVGPPGIGKTTVGLQFLSECDRDNPGVYFGFYETPAAIVDKAKAFGLPIEQLVAEGHIEIIWQPTSEGLLDEVCHRLIEAVRRRKTRRLFIDGLQGFHKLAPERERLGRIFSAFSSEFRGRGVTTLYTSEADLIGPVLGLPLSGLSLEGVSCIAEIILVMRYVELRAQLYRMISVLKVRDAQIDCALRQFTITSKGIVIEPDSTAAEQIITQAASLGGLGANVSGAGRDRGD